MSWCGVGRWRWTFGDGEDAWGGEGSVWLHVCSCESSYVRCLMLLNCFHTRTMLVIESRRVFCFDVGDN